MQHIRYIMRAMALYTVSEAAQLLNVSPDTIRRWITSGKLESSGESQSRKLIPGVSLAQLAENNAPPSPHAPGGSSARNRARGLVTGISKNSVMAQVDVQCGPFRFVSLMSAEAVNEMGLHVGATADIVVKATTVIVEVPR